MPASDRFFRMARHDIGHGTDARRALDCDDTNGPTVRQETEAQRMNEIIGIVPHPLTRPSAEPSKHGAATPSAARVLPVRFCLLTGGIFPQQLSPDR